MKKISVDEYLLNNSKWQQALSMLREIMQGLGMEEDVKWGGPVYCIKGDNVIGIGAFKHHVALWFYQGVFLSDPLKILYTADEGSTRALRQWRFQSADEIEEHLEHIISYVREAIVNSEKGMKIKPLRNKPFEIPEDLKSAFTNDPELKKQYDLLSHTKQREYSLYIGQAKRAETRKKRLDQSIPLIREGIGLMDRYSKR